jgi:hypothetical protein
MMSATPLSHVSTSRQKAPTCPPPQHLLFPRLPSFQDLGITLFSWHLRHPGGFSLYLLLVALLLTQPYVISATTFVAPTAIPPARRTYGSDNPIHMADLSVRWMGTGDERMRRTLELNRGLTPTTGRVPTLNFPQGKFVQGQTPKVRKDKVHHLHRASICEVVFTDTFETGDHHYRYGQAFVDYRSRYGDVIPLRSRKQVGWSFGEFCCRNFTPLILIRDNISENKGGGLGSGMSSTRGSECFHLPLYAAARSG